VARKPDLLAPRGLAYDGRAESWAVPSTRRLAAILFTDMVGFTTAAHRHEARALELLQEQERIVRPIVRAHGGNEVKSTGDGSLVELPSALQAVECAIEIQRRLHDRNAATDAPPIHLRIGVHVGDVESRDADIFGDAVNIAARVLSVAEPDGIALTEQVAHHLENKLELPVENLGLRGLKGVDRPIPVYRVVLPWSAPAQLAPPAVLPRLAVLPLRNISPDPRDAYFADGLTEELISVLGQVRELRVIARSSVARFGSGDRAVATIGQELGASAVLEGSVRKAGERLRISLQLVDVATQEGLWTQTFDRRLDDVFAVQAEVGERTAAALRIRMFGASKAALHRLPTANLEAYGLYLQGLHLTRTLKTGDATRAADLFRRAIEADPSFASAYAHLAHRLLGFIGDTRPAREVIPEVRPIVEKAVSLDPESPEAHSARGNLAMQGDLDWAIAEAEFRRALELNPSDFDSRSWYALLLRALQRYSDAEEQARMLLELDPLSPSGPTLLASILRLRGSLEESLAVARTRLRLLLGPSEYHMNMAYTYFYGARTEEARHELAQIPDPGPGHRGTDHAILLARLGDSSEARSQLEAAEALSRTAYVPTLQLVILAAATGDRERAIAYLQQDWEAGDRGLWFVYQGLGFDPIRSDPRFVRMLERMRLPTSAPFYRDGRVS